MRYFYAQRNRSVPGEWQVFMNGEIFCHLSESDLNVFIKGFKYHVDVLED